MDNNKQKFGSLYKAKSTKNNVFSSNSSNLFNLSSDNPITKDDKLNKEPDNQKFINDVDSSLIMENIDKTAKNKVVKINLKLKTLEKNLFQINEELKILELFNLDKDKQRRDELRVLKDNIIYQINKLKTEKKKYGIFYIISAYTDDKINIEKCRKLFNYVVVWSNKYYKLMLNYINNNSEISELFGKIKVLK